MEKIYLDYAATTPVDKRVIRAMEPYLSEEYGNPGSLHSFGQKAIAAVDSARDRIAKELGTEFGDVIFTGSATEANNLALRGALKGLKIKNPKIIVSAIEHESVLRTAYDLESDGVEVVVVPVTSDGIIDIDKFRELLDDRTTLVSIMYANNETGTVQPVSEISKIIKDFNHEILFHTDAVQAFQYFDCKVNDLGVDLMTLSAHKIYGPKGVGALYVRGRGIPPVITGGGQEFGVRSGTENVPGIAGFAGAIGLVSELREKERDRAGILRDHLWGGIKEICPGAEINGRVSDNNLPNILNIYFSGRNAEELLVRFDEVGIAVSAGSACEARSARPSHVLAAMGFSEERAKSSLRFSLGKPTTEKEVDMFLDKARGILS